jgi:hypothetical protein
MAVSYSTHDRQIMWSSLAISLLGECFSRFKAFFRAENQTVPSMIGKVLLTVVTYVFVFTRVSDGIMFTIAFLFDHRWLLLTVTCSLALLAISALFLALYEFIWRWQQQDCIRMVMLTQQQQQQRARNITVEDDDNMWQSYLKQAGRILLILALWVVFCVANTKLQFWIWHYLAAHPDHNAEIQFVNCLEVAPLLFGAAFCMYYLYPPFYTWNYDGQASVSNTNGNHSETLQTLL